MTDADLSAVPSDPAMAANDPAMFVALTGQDSGILSTHLTSGWYKQAAVYPVLSEPWRETSVVLDDIHLARNAALDAERARRQPAREAQAETEPEAGS